MKRFGMTFIIAALTLILLIGQVAWAETGINQDELFTSQDMQQSADRNEAEPIELADGQDILIEAGGSWILSGSASNVTIRVDAGEDAEVRLFLDEVNISNQDLPCIYVEKAGKLIVTLSGDNMLAVRKDFQKKTPVKANGVIYSRSDLTLNGDGSLTISSPKNGIVCRDRLRITGGNYTINADSKAIAADNAIWISDGSFLLTAESDGLHAENEDIAREGSVFIGGGNFEIYADDDAIHGQSLVQIESGTITIYAAEGLESTWVLINGGTLDIHAEGDGINAGWKNDIDRPRLEINGGQVSVVMSGEDTDAIDSNADLIITGGVIELIGSGFDYEGNLEFSGGKVIINGNEVTSIMNQN